MKHTLATYLALYLYVPFITLRIFIATTLGVCLVVIYLLVRRKARTAKAIRSVQAMVVALFVAAAGEYLIGQTNVLFILLDKYFIQGISTSPWKQSLAYLNVPQKIIDTVAASAQVSYFYLVLSLLAFPMRSAASWKAPFPAAPRYLLFLSAILSTAAFIHFIDRNSTLGVITHLYSDFYYYELIALAVVLALIPREWPPWVKTITLPRWMIASCSTCLRISRKWLIGFWNLCRYHIKRTRRLRRLKRALARKRMEALAASRKTALVSATHALALAPLETMYLKLKRSQKHNIWGSVIFVLDARMNVPAEVRQYIYTYSLGNRLVYESEERQRHREEALAHGMASADAAGNMGWTPSAGQVGKAVLKTAWKLGRAGVSATRAAMALRITISNLLDGVHIECVTMEELLQAESQIRDAANSLKAYIDTAKTFSGTEEIVEL